MTVYKNGLRNAIIRQLLRAAERNGEPPTLAYLYIKANYQVPPSHARKILATPPPSEQKEDQHAASALASLKETAEDYDFPLTRLMTYPYGRALFLHMQAFPTEESCLNALDIRCTRCGSCDATRLRRARHWRCKSCGRRFSAVPRAHLSLRKLKAAEFLMEVSCGAISAKGLSDLLQISRNTATRLLRARK